MNRKLAQQIVLAVKPFKLYSPQEDKELIDRMNKDYLERHLSNLHNWMKVKLRHNSDHGKLKSGDIGYVEKSLYQLKKPHWDQGKAYPIAVLKDLHDPFNSHDFVKGPVDPV